MVNGTINLTGLRGTWAFPGRIILRVKSHPEFGWHHPETEGLDVIKTRGPTNAGLRQLSASWLP